MPNRLLKEGICTSDAINLLSSDSEVLFYRLLVVSDDYGRMDGRSQIVKSQCFPLKESFTTKKIESSLMDLCSVGLIQNYIIDGKSFFFINKWDQRQRSKSKYPAPLTADGGQPADNPPQPAKKCGLGLGLGLGKGKGKGEALEHAAIKSALPCPYESIVNLYYKHMPNNPKILKLDDTRKKLIKGRWDEAAKGISEKSEGYKTVEDGLILWASFFIGCNASDFLTGKAQLKGSGDYFIANIDFLFRKSAFLRILEGKYKNKP